MIQGKIINEYRLNLNIIQIIILCSIKERSCTGLTDMTVSINDDKSFHFGVNYPFKDLFLPDLKSPQMNVT